MVCLLFVELVARVFVKLLDEQDEFRLLAAAGLAIQFGAQAMINMLVNTGMAPSKGMTLPFISYGGSSMIALSIGRSEEHRSELQSLMRISYAVFCLKKKKKYKKNNKYKKYTRRKNEKQHK